MAAIYDAELPQGLIDDEALSALAARQHGAISRAQVYAAGGTRNTVRRRVRAKGWISASPDVFRIRGSVPTWRQSLMVAVLAWGPDAYVSHRAAGSLFGLPGLTEQPAELTVPRDRRRRGAPGIVHEGDVDALDCTVVDGIPVTTIARTLVDIAAVCDRDLVEEIYDDARARRLVGVRQMRWQMGRMRGRPGVAVIRAVVAARDGRGMPANRFETRLHRLIVHAGLPEPVIQHSIYDQTGRFVARPDLAYPDLRLAIEADGREPHERRTQFQRDRRRFNDLADLGWRIFFVTWQDLTDTPDEVVARLAAILRGAGTPGDWRPRSRGGSAR